MSLETQSWKNENYSKHILPSSAPTPALAGGWDVSVFSHPSRQGVLAITAFSSQAKSLTLISKHQNAFDHTPASPGLRWLYFQLIQPPTHSSGLVPSGPRMTFVKRGAVSLRNWALKHFQTFVLLAIRLLNPILHPIHSASTSNVASQDWII